MSEVLLDTHALLWFLFDDPRLSARAVAILEDEQIGKLLSIVSLWEITIKVQLTKLSLGMPLDVFFQRFVRDAEINLLEITLPHLLAYEKLPLHHRDPFDRLLVAQAKILDTPLLTSNPAFRRYGVETVW